VTQINIKVPPEYYDSTVLIQVEPDECPICHRKQVPKLLVGRRVDDSHVDMSYQCTNSECRHLFVSRYYTVLPSDLYDLSGSVPTTVGPIYFADEISEVSPDFCATFNQSSAAESYELGLIAGCGYRKSLEFLIKDYLISVLPADRDVIRSAPLGACITDRVDDPRLKSTARRATWLGNDETHYSRKWETKDIEDLKTLIQLTVNWVQSSLLTKKYEKDMSD
jgi:hypothetical protein